MAIILNTDNYEKNFYQKILLERSFINKDGLYISTIVYNDKNEREKEKFIEPAVNNFLKNCASRISEIDAKSDKEKEGLLDEYNSIKRVLDLMEQILYSSPYTEERVAIDQKDIIVAEKYGFSMDWYNYPIIIVRSDTIRVDDYKKQNFDLESFYQSLKQNIYTDVDGTSLSIDDL